VLAVVAAIPVLAQQVPPDLARERAEYARWLLTADLSPYAAIALQPIGTGLTIGPAPADIVLPGISRAVISETRAAAQLVQGALRRLVPGNRPVDLGNGYQVIVAGPAGRRVLAAYGPVREARAPEYFGYQPRLAYRVSLRPPERSGRFRILGPDGVETEAAEAGLVTVPLAGDSASLRVYVVGAEDQEISELLVFFRDQSSGRGSYPAGRFVELLPLSGGRYWLDFNRARNPFCAYNAVFPCPAPWPGNQVAGLVEAGERYAGGGLELD